MSDEYTNDDFLNALREAQGSARPKGYGNFNEWGQEHGPFGKANFGASNGGHYSPGFGLMGGSLNTNSRAPTGPSNRPSGNNAVGLKQFPQQFGVPSGVDYRQSQSQYANARPNQPPPWIDDVDMSSIWYSPMEPVWPFGPPFYNMPREWNYPVGYNINFVPQRLDLMGMLRGMRGSWGVLSTIIETRKDQLLRLPWTIQVKGKPRANSKGIEIAKKFFKRPDGILSYGQWTRKYLDDLFVIDAPTIYLDRDNGGQLRRGEILDGGSIFPLIDDAGRRPQSITDVSPTGIVYERRQPAFQQIIYGLPMINLSEDELIYGMMRPRPELPIFGYSPVEQILTETTEAIRKTFYQLEFWRAGSMPELIVTVPEQWTPRQIATFQAHFDAVLSGQLTLKSKVRFVPGGMKPFDVKNASGESLWSQRDELLVRLACYAFSVSPTPFVKQTNRATAGQAQEAAEEEGLYPLMSYWKDDVADTIIQEKLGLDDVEFVYLPRSEPDQVKQSTIHKVQIDEGIRSRNDVRGELGLEPTEGGDVITVLAGNMVVRLDQIIAGDVLIPGAPPPGDNPRPAPETKPSGHTDAPVKGSPAPSRASTGKPQSEPSTVTKRLTAKDIRHAARQTKRNPSASQKKLGNYPKGKISYNGLKLTIENEKGSDRGEKDSLGVKHSVKMPSAYGYINGTIGADGMQVDCYIGKHPESPVLWIVDQDKFASNGEDKGFDEHKVMLCFKSFDKAMKAYLKSHYDGLGHERASAVVQLNYDELKRWLKKGDMKRPISEQGIGHVVARRGVGGGITKADTISQGTGLLNYDQSVGLVPKKKAKKSKRKLRQSRGPRWLSLVA